MSEDTSTSPSSSSKTQSSRMENGEKLPVVAPGIFHRKPQPILSVLNPQPAASVSFSPDLLSQRVMAIKQLKVNLGPGQRKGKQSKEKELI
ncbi:hypothetical protein WR25_18656 [Diploscapter pachys]|uniref:Uncharacterized protein n=1 Tax=Diploscapter pachys TaxID=2018661 RepID=A0A2A2LJL4_9BILA|nr:hypothetical protein WR25_18656 [Diploscapter pachys]